MIENSKNENTKKRTREKIDRVPLTQASLDIIDEAIKAVKSKHPGVSLNRRLFSNWLVQKYFKQITPATEKLLTKEFYDEIKFLENGLKELKRRKKNGEEVSIAKVLKEANPKINSTPKKRSAPTRTIKKIEKDPTPDSPTQDGKI